MLLTILSNSSEISRILNPEKYLAIASLLTKFKAYYIGNANSCVGS